MTQENKTLADFLESERKEFEGQLEGFNYHFSLDDNVLLKDMPDWLSSHDQRLLEYVREMIRHEKQLLTNASLLEEHSMDRCRGLGQGERAFDRILTLLTPTNTQ